jgi:divalent metal cation (Fe/Co/Zn/Cd) transporter
VNRNALVERARLLSIISVLLGGALGGLAVVVGLATSRLSLLGFGFDAAIDSLASIVLVWRFQIERDHPARAERAERLAERAIGVVLVAIAADLTVNAVIALAAGTRPEATTTGLAISITSIAVLPLLAVLKYRVAAALESRALRADSILTGVAALLAVFTTVGYILTEVFALAWADSVAALVVAAVLVREGVSAFRPRGLAAVE